MTTLLQHCLNNSGVETQITALPRADLEKIAGFMVASQNVSSRDVVKAGRTRVASDVQPLGDTAIESILEMIS